MKMARNYDTSLFGENVGFQLTPDLLAFEMSLDFSSQVIELCEKKGLTLRELAKKIGIKESTLSEKLNGQNLTLKSIADFAIALDCDALAPTLFPNNKQKSFVSLDPVQVKGTQQTNTSWSEVANITFSEKVKFDAPKKCSDNTNNDPYSKKVA